MTLVGSAEANVGSDPSFLPHSCDKVTHLSPEVQQVMCVPGV